MHPQKRARPFVGIPEYTDDIGHKYGDSKQFQKAMRYLDAQVEKLWSAVQYRHKRFG
jgi:hypothetical protein